MGGSSGGVVCGGCSCSFGASTGSKVGAGAGSFSHEGTSGVFGPAPPNEEEVPITSFASGRQFVQRRSSGTKHRVFVLIRDFLYPFLMLCACFCIGQ